MKGLSTFARAGGLFAASILLAGALLGLPRSTNESSAPGAPAAPPEMVRAAGPAAQPASTVPRSGNTAPQSGNIAPQAAAAVPRQDRPNQVHGPERPAAGGMVIGIDPETGKLGMPTREQLKELSDLEQRRLDHSSADLIEVHHPDGSVSVDLQGRFQEFATVQIGPDGKLIFECVEGAENAERVLKSAAGGPTEGAPHNNTPAPARPESEER